MMTLALAAEALKARLVGPDVRFTGVSTDTRTLQPGDLFVALRGDRYDGHDFVAEAVAAGAAGGLFERAIETALPYVLVDNTRRALGELAAYWRRHFGIPLVAVTGSNGKTTVKEMIAAILAETGPGCVTRGNLNNDIGVPLTLLRLRATDRYAVVEMGMNHLGEIEYLSRMSRPTVAVITNAAEAHLAGVGSLEGVARAKGEIFAGLVREGVAVLNADDPFFAFWKTLASPHRVVSFGLGQPADVTARYAPAGLGGVVGGGGGQGYRLQLKTTQGEIDVRLPLLGKHNVMNALAATAAAMEAGAALSEVRRGLEKLKAVAGRLEVKEGISGARLIDDTYNANPGSLAAGLEVLREFEGERVLVLGDMAELGAQAAAIHRRVGELARRLGIHRLYALGELTRETVAAYGKGARHFDSPEALVDALKDCMHADMTVLVKGSRAMRMERVVAGLVRAAPSLAAGGTVTKEEN
jgi:UDP-N-acetylmuramoyl-tripeptide--D-alanyl-D-alanine ligase